MNMLPNPLCLRTFVVLLSAPIALVACGSGDAREEPVPTEAIWGPDDVDQRGNESQVDYRDRADGAAYGLPRSGMSSIADLIALYPDQPLRFDDPDLFVAPGTEFDTDQCRGGAPAVRNDLPMEIEAVVTLYPRSYFKVTVCGQDERNYGSFTVEDDTGGILVLRDSRVTPWSFGDRVKLTVYGTMLTFGPELDTRAILMADIEPLDAVKENGEIVKPVTYQWTSDVFGPDDVAMTKRVEGYVHVEPTNMNFNSMVVTSEPVELGARFQDVTGDALQCTLTCEVAGRSRCPEGTTLGDICYDACINAGTTEVAPESLPVCWQIGIDAELGRRGFQPQYGQKLRATGPVVNGFDRNMLVISTAQIEFLED